jgi:ornithine carbamoyltransferase
MSDFLSVTDLSADELAAVLDAARRLKADSSLGAGALAGKRVGLFFEKPSNRTRVSCEVATVDTGAHPVVLKGDEIGLGKREPVADVARTLDRYLDVLAARVFRHEHLEEMAQHAAAPVINLLSDLEHPCQAMADLQTIAEHRALPGTTVAYLGDGNNVCHSLMLAGALAGMHLRVAAPPGFEPDAAVTARAVALAAAGGGSTTVTTDADAAVAGADVVYTDVWTSMGQEAEAAERKQRLAGYQLDAARFGRAASDAIFLHCLPAHRGEEVTPDVIEHERSRVFDQAENRMHSFKAVLLWTMGNRP